MTTFSSARTYNVRNKTCVRRSIASLRLLKVVYKERYTKLGVYDAFNIENVGKCLVLKKLGLPVGKNCVEVLKKHDMVRLGK